MTKEYDDAVENLIERAALVVEYHDEGDLSTTTGDSHQIELLRYALDLLELPTKPEPPVEPPEPEYPTEPILIEDTGRLALNGSRILSYKSPEGKSIITSPGSGDTNSTTHDGRYVAILDDHLAGGWRIYDTELREFIEFRMWKAGAIVLDWFLWCHKSHDFITASQDERFVKVQRASFNGSIKWATSLNRHLIGADGDPYAVQWRTSATSGAKIQYLMAVYSTEEPLVGGGTGSLPHYGFQAIDTETGEFAGEFFWLEEKAVVNSNPVTTRPHNAWLGIDGIVFSPAYLGGTYANWQHTENLQSVEHWISFSGNDFTPIEPVPDGGGNAWSHQCFDKDETGKYCMYGCVDTRDTVMIKLPGPTYYHEDFRWEKEVIARLFGNKHTEIGYAHATMHNGTWVVSYTTNNPPYELCIFQIDSESYRMIPLVDWYPAPAITEGDPNDRFYAWPRPVCAEGLVMWHTGSPVELRSIELK